MNDIRLSVSSLALAPLGLEDSLREFQQLGIGTVELIALRRTMDLVKDWDAAAIAALLGRYNLKLAAIYTAALNIHDPAKLEEDKGYVIRTMDIAAALGCRNIVICPLLPRDGYQYAVLADSLSALAQEIGGRDLRLCIENHHGWPMDKTADYERVFDRCKDPRVGATLDTGHFGASRVDMLAFVERFHPRIFHLHVKEQIGTKCVPFGTGETGNPSVFTALRGKGYHGYASIEVELDPDIDPAAYLRSAVEYSRNTLHLAG